MFRVLFTKSSLLWTVNWSKGLSDITLGLVVMYCLPRIKEGISDNKNIGRADSGFAQSVRETISLVWLSWLGQLSRSSHWAWHFTPLALLYRHGVKGKLCLEWVLQSMMWYWSEVALRQAVGSTATQPQNTSNNSLKITHWHYVYVHANGRNALHTAYMYLSCDRPKWPHAF